MVRLEKSLVQAQTNVLNSDLLSITLPLINRMKVEDKSKNTIASYVRAVECLIRFHNLTHPKDLDVEQVIDFLVDCKDVKHNKWRTSKMYVAGIRYYWTHMLENKEFAYRIPYPKEHRSLPKILSREELQLLFNSCKDPKHKVIFKLMYSSGLRRNELINLKIHDIDTKDGKMRIRINKAKGKKDRYTVLSHSVLADLRAYYLKYKPVDYLFNGQHKGQKLGEDILRRALQDARKISGITKQVNLHILRHCFATHSLEHGMYIKRLQIFLGHTTLKTTLIYLQVSDTPHTPDFSPLDLWENEGKEKL